MAAGVRPLVSALTASEVGLSSELVEDMETGGIRGCKTPWGQAAGYPGVQSGAGRLGQLQRHS